MASPSLATLVPLSSTAGAVRRSSLAPVLPINRSLCPVNSGPQSWAAVRFSPAARSAGQCVARASGASASYASLASLSKVTKYDVSQQEPSLLDKLFKFVLQVAMFASFISFALCNTGMAHARGKPQREEAPVPPAVVLVVPPVTPLQAAREQLVLMKDRVVTSKYGVPLCVVLVAVLGLGALRAASSGNTITESANGESEDRTVGAVASNLSTSIAAATSKDGVVQSSPSPPQALIPRAPPAIYPTQKPAPAPVKPVAVPAAVALAPAPPPPVKPSPFKTPVGPYYAAPPAPKPAAVTAAPKPAAASAPTKPAAVSAAVAAAVAPASAAVLAATASRPAAPSSVTTAPVPSPAPVPTPVPVAPTPTRAVVADTPESTAAATAAAAAPQQPPAAIAAPAAFAAPTAVAAAAQAVASAAAVDDGSRTPPVVTSSPTADSKAVPAGSSKAYDVQAQPAAAAALIVLLAIALTTHNFWL